MSRWEIVGIAVNGVVGSGVYLLPAAAAAILGPASLWAVPLAGLAVTLLVLCFAEAAGHFDRAGSGYLYAREAFGDFVGFEVGWLMVLTKFATTAALTNGFVQAVGFYWPAITAGAGRVALIGAVFAFVGGINLIGVRWATGTITGFAIVKVLPLLVLVVAGLLTIDLSAVPVAAIGSSGDLGRATLLLLFAYAGFENVAAAAGEYRDPRRDVPFGLVTMIVSVTALYFLVQLVSLAALPDLAAHADGAPLAVVATRVMGSAGGALLTAGAAVSIFGTILSTSFNGPRYLFALAEDGFGPRALTRVHPRWRTPHVAILALAALGLLLAISGTFVQLALLSMVTRMATYLGTAAAVPVLRRERPHVAGRFRIPAGPLVPLLALMLTSLFLLSATPTKLLAGGVALAVGIPLYVLRRRPTGGGAVAGGSPRDR